MAGFEARGEGLHNWIQDLHDVSSRRQRKGPFSREEGASVHQHSVGFAGGGGKVQAGRVTWRPTLLELVWKEAEIRVPYQVRLEDPGLPERLSGGFDLVQAKKRRTPKEVDPGRKRALQGLIEAGEAGCRFVQQRQRLLHVALEEEVFGQVNAPLNLSVRGR